MVFSIQIAPSEGVVSPLPAGERFCRALKYGMWEDADAVVANLMDKDKEYLITFLRNKLRENGYAIEETEHPYPNPNWYVTCPGLGKQYRRLFLRAIPALIQWSQECSVTKTLLGVDCLFTAIRWQDYETVRLIISLDPQAVLRRGIGGRVALHHAGLAPHHVGESAFGPRAQQRAIDIVNLIHVTALKALYIKDHHDKTPLDCINAALGIETNPEKREMFVQICKVLENPPSELLALGLSVARAEKTPCPLRRFVLNKLFEPRILRVILSFLSF